MVAQQFLTAIAVATIFVASVSGYCPDTGNRVQLVEKYDGNFNGNDYILVTDPKQTWQDATATCASYCGVLTSVQSNEEMQYLVSMIRNFEAEKPQDAWKTGHALIGGYRVGSEGKEYRWIETGEPVGSFIWSGGNPYASDTQAHYTILWDKVNGTEDHHVGLQKDNFICKILGQGTPAQNETGFTCDGRECGSYPDPRNCSLYYVCGGNGTVEHKTCAHGLYFDQVTRSCDLSTFAVCAEEFTCEGKQCGRYPDPNNCTQFYICEGNDTRMDVQRMTCPHGLKFDVITGTCDIAEYATCGGNYNSTSGLVTEVPYPETTGWYGRHLRSLDETRVFYDDTEGRCSYTGMIVDIGSCTSFARCMYQSATQSYRLREFSCQTGKTWCASQNSCIVEGQCYQTCPIEAAT